jgi:glutamyl-tRNA synthetase
VQKPGRETKASGSEKILPPLPNADKYEEIVTRFAPNPDFVLHLGSVRAIILSHDYARMYEGKFLVRFEDTDPRLKKSALEYYDAIREDLRWLECPWDEEYIQSDRLQIYYDYAAKLLEQGDIYVCTCERKSFTAKANAGQSCPCRPKGPSENLRDWQKMLDGGFNEGEAVVRVKTELTHPNPAVRDWPALRVIDPEQYPHPRVGSKYRVWPLYNWSAGIDDHLMGVTHVFRGKEHLTNSIRQTYLYKYLGWNYPEAIHYGRLKAVGINLSKSLMVKQLEAGEVDGYSDPRLATLAALRRRGYSPNALRKIIYEVGPRPVDVTLSWENVNAADRKEIDKMAHRYHFVQDPIPLEVLNVPRGFEAHLPLHPEKPELGTRTLKVGPHNGTVRIWLSRNDYEVFAKFKVIRLMELFNVEVETAAPTGVKARFHSQEYEKARAIRAPLVQWLPETQQLSCQVAMPDASRAKGFVEDSILAEPVGSIVQMVRFGFGRIDHTSKSGIVVYYAHR